jgi:hypothetical protein
LKEQKEKMVTKAKVDIREILARLAKSDHPAVRVPMATPVDKDPVENQASREPPDPKDLSGLLEMMVKMARSVPMAKMVDKVIVGPMDPPEKLDPQVEKESKAQTANRVPKVNPVSTEYREEMGLLVWMGKRVRMAMMVL